MDFSLGGLLPSDPLEVVIHQLPRRLLAGADEYDIQRLLRTTYPELADSLPPQGLLDPVIDGAEDKVHLHRSLPSDSGRHEDDLLSPYDVDQGATKIGMWRGNKRWLIPKLGGNPAPPHILVLWWALLFALSMRARYDPEGWTRDLDPDQSTSAVVLETMLDMSMGICPELIVEAMPSV
jgi:hypothetical protein